MVAGRLELHKRAWRLTLFGWLGPWPERRSGHDYPTLIHGEVGATQVTLLDTVIRGWDRLGQSPPLKSEVAANTVLTGALGSTETRFKRASVRLLYLNEWADRAPWKWTYGESDGVTFTNPGVLTADLPGATATLRRSLVSHDHLFSYVTMESDEWVDFDFQKPTGLEALMRLYVRPLESLITLAAVQNSVPLDLTAVPVEEGDDTAPVRILSEIDRDFLAPKPFVDMLFDLRDVTFEELLPAWWQLYCDKEMAIVVDLLESLDGPGYPGPQFFTAASTIEAYHHRQFGKPKVSPEHRQRLDRINEKAPVEDRAWLKEKLAWSHVPSFAEVIDEVVDRAGGLFPPAVGNVTKWRRWVKEARHSVAHRDPSKVDVDRDWRTTVRITPTIRWLLVLVLLRDLGLSDEVIEAGVRNQGGLAAATENLQTEKPEWFS